MAKRVAGKRQGLLYGLIAMIAVSIIFAVLFFLKTSELQETRQLFDSSAQDLNKVQAELKKLQDRLANSGVSTKGQSLKDQVEALLTDNNRYRQGINNLANEISRAAGSDATGLELLSYVKGQIALSEMAKAEATKTLEIAPKLEGVTGIQVASPTSLNEAVSLLGLHVKALDEAYKARQLDIQKAAQNNESLQSTLDTNTKNAEEKYNQMVQSKDTEIAGLRTKVEEVQKESDDRERQREALKNEFTNYRVAAAEQLQLKINRQIELESQIKELLDKVKRETTGVAQPDGTIVSLMPGERTGYIDLAAGDGVFTNLSFVVYDPAEVALGKEKGYVSIVNVMDNASEVVITSYKKTNPIVKGDVITNIVYDRARRFHFAVVGHFDIDGDGKDDSQTIKHLIERFGGKVDDKLNVRSDYLVVGDDPMSTFKAPTIGGLTGQDKVLEEELKGQQKAYGEATDLAQRFWIPVLNQNRFLTLIGVRPAGEE
ncbi:MAG: hypothetical protein JXL80_09605 [Planctomycetes bacterium]|nr:hypothetical protein [Planctomycetota bacterium]